ncbi:MAG: hypothetical protein LVS60_08485 [Nodosilinea sp. LVE1205-7]|jgi:4-diphosphocytidyl-2-C-methyl-D-erythritol kinase
MLAAISHHQSSDIGRHLYNDLEKVVLPAHDKTAELKATMASLGGLGTLMSGSGPTVFTLVNSQAEAEKLMEQISMALPDPDLGLWTAQCVPTGVQLVES